MNDGQLDSYFDDLKQFWTATLSQSEARLEAKLTARIESSETSLSERIDSLEVKLSRRIDSLEINFGRRIDDLEQKMDDGFAGIADIMEIQNDRLDNHEKRLVAIEQPVA